MTIEVPEPRYQIVRKSDGIDTLHVNAREECNLDDADHVETITPARAVELKMGGHARLCRHCFPAEEPST